MALIKSCNNKTPTWGEHCWFAENATLVGDLSMGNDCSVWFNAVVRADVHYIKMGNKVNIQDGAVIHCTYPNTPTIIGSNVSIGHNAIVHGCTIKDNVLIGMGAIVMDNTVVNEGAIVAAGAVVLENTEIECGSIYAGVPAKKAKSGDLEQMRKVMLEIADKYVMYKGWFKE